MKPVLTAAPFARGSGPPIERVLLAPERGSGEKEERNKIRHLVKVKAKEVRYVHALLEKTNALYAALSGGCGCATRHRSCPPSVQAATLCSPLKASPSTVPRAAWEGLGFG